MDGLGGPPVFADPSSRQITESLALEMAAVREKIAEIAEIEREIALVTSIRDSIFESDLAGNFAGDSVDVSDDNFTDNDDEHSRQGFSRPGNKGNNNQKSGGTPSPGGTPYQSTSNLAPRVPPLPNSPSFASSLTGATAMDEGVDDKQFKFKEPLWYNEKWTRQVVKGNFMTIVARPKIVEDGEWLAHQGMLFTLSIGHIPSFCLTRCASVEVLS